MDTPASDEINPHYLNHVVETSRSHTVEASEDIVAGNGVKLLAKGTPINAQARDKLLVHKLRRPLEDCIQIADGVTGEKLKPIAEGLLAQQPLMQALCIGEAAASVPAMLGALVLTPPMQTLLTVYSKSNDDKLQHATGVALLAVAMAKKLFPGDGDRHRQIALAGMLHDVGELYIDPSYVRKGARLETEQWRHVVTHPLVGHRVLRDMAGAGRAVADAVLLHHERLDGFGYPRAVSGDECKLDGQVLAAAEWLMALIESGLTPMARASVASRLIPHEFAPPLVKLVTDAARALPEAQAALASIHAMPDAAQRVARIARTLAAFREARGWIDTQLAGTRGLARSVVEASLQRMLRIQTSFSSAGLDALPPEALVADVTDHGDPQAHLEFMHVVQELEWRLREMERESVLRSGVFSPEERAMLDELIVRLKHPADAEADTDAAKAEVG